VLGTIPKVIGLSLLGYIPKLEFKYFDTLNYELQHISNPSNKMRLKYKPQKKVWAWTTGIKIILFDLDIKLSCTCITVFIYCVVIL